MRLFIFFLTLCLISISSSAKNSKKVNLSPSYEQKEDPGSATDLLYKVENPKLGKGKSSKIRMTASCTDSLGMVHTKEDPGYEACLHTLENAAPETRKDREKQSIGITISK